MGFVFILTLPVPSTSESCIEIKIKLNFYFHTFTKPFEAPKRSVKRKIWLNFFSLSRIGTGRVKTSCFSIIKILRFFYVLHFSVLMKRYCHSHYVENSSLDWPDFVIPSFKFSRIPFDFFEFSKFRSRTYWIISLSWFWLRHSVVCVPN